MSLRVKALVAGVGALMATAAIHCLGDASAAPSVAGSSDGGTADGQVDANAPDSGSRTAFADAGLDAGLSRIARKALLMSELEVYQRDYERAKSAFESTKSQVVVAPTDASVIANDADAGAQLAVAADRVDRVQKELDKLDEEERVANATDAGPDPKKFEEVEFQNGSRLRYGVTASVLQLTFTRSESEPARLRNYAPKLDFVPPEVGFSFTYQPAAAPWRYRLRDGRTFQLVSWGGMMLVQLDKPGRAQGALRLGATLNFFENTIGLGVGVDLYRGIPVLGPGNGSGTGTAYTGLLSWAFTKEGEVTPENVYFVVTFGLDRIVNALTGEVK